MSQFSHQSNVSPKDKQLVYTTFLQREEGDQHFGYNEELLQYEYLRDGDLRSIPESKRMFALGAKGDLSDDPVRDRRYLFVASVTLATRFAIEGGLWDPDAFNISDLYIRQMDKLQSVEQIDSLHTEMIRDFTEKIIELKKTKADLAENRPKEDPSDPVIYPDSEGQSVHPIIASCIDYIYYHLHERISLSDLADHVHLSPNYLSTLFKKEKGLSVQAYIRGQRITAAKNMLLYSDYSETEISEFLAFSTPSHFIRIFKAETGRTPKQFKKENYHKHVRWASV